MPRIMLTSRIFDNIEDTISYAREYHFQGVEWYLNQLRIPINQEKAHHFFQKLDDCPGMYFSFHLPTTDVEIGHQNKDYADTSLQYLKMYIDILSPWLQKQSHPTVFTLHIGANSIPMKMLNWRRTRDHLKDLGEYTYNNNGLLCLENLKMGWTADTAKLIELVDYAGIHITFDSGHAASSAIVRNQTISLLDYLDTIQSYVRYVHFYDYETLQEGYHVPPDQWEKMQSIWDKILTLKNLYGITLELIKRHELEWTYQLIKKYANRSSY